MKQRISGYTFITEIVILLVLLISCSDKSRQSRHYVKQGIDLLYKTDLEGAEKNFQKAAHLDPANHEAWFYIGVVYQNRRAFREAISYFDRAIEIKNDYADAYYNRGLCWFYLGDRNQSCSDWLMAEDLGKENISDRTDKCRQDTFINPQ